MAARDMDQALAVLRQVLEETKELDRRAFLTRLGQAAAGSALLGSFAGMLGKAARAAEPVTTMGWGGAWQDAMEAAFFEPWTERSGAPVRYVTPYSFSKLRAMNETGQQQIDIVETGNVDMLQLIKYGMTVPLDFDVVDKSALTPNQLKYKTGVGGLVISTLYAYNTEKWPGDDHPKDWADFWNVEKFPGPRSMMRDVYVTLESALMADGVPADPAQMYPLDVERAFRKLDEIKPHVVTWWKSGSEPQQLIQDEEVDLCVMWSGRAVDSIRNNGAHYAAVWNQALYNGDCAAWFLMKGSPNPEDGMKLLDFVGRAEPQAAFARTLFYGPTNLKAYDFIDAELARNLPSYPKNVEVSLTIDYEWWLDRIDPLTKRFEGWLQA